MLVHERYRYITRAIQSQASVATLELARALHVSTETVRRDLVALEKQGTLRRVYGGAVAPRRQQSSEPPFAQRGPLTVRILRSRGRARRTVDTADSLPGRRTLCARW